MGKDIDRGIEEAVEDEVEERLEADSQGIFSKKEVMDAVRKRIRWKGSGRDPHLTNMRQNDQMSRRKFLQMLGLGMGGGFIAASGVGYFMGTKVFGNGEHAGFLTGMQTSGGDAYTIRNAPGSNTVRTSSLDEALSSFESGNKVILAPKQGGYEWSGGSSISTSSGDCSLIGDGEVTLNLNGSFGGGLRNDSGTSLVKNITIRGKADTSTKAGFDIGGSGKKVYDNVNMPDGTTDTNEGRAFYTPKNHDGVGVVRNGYYANFGSDTLYTDDGEVHADGVMTQNNNISMIRLGGANSSARNCVVVVDGDIPHAENGGRSARGIRIRQPGDNIVIENCDCTYTAEPYGGAPIELHGKAKGGSGVIRDVRILNDTGVDAINDKGIGISNWKAENVCIKGSGNLDHPFSSGVSVGNSCPDPRLEAPQASGKKYGAAPTGGSSTNGNDGPC